MKRIKHIPTKKEIITNAKSELVSEMNKKLPNTFLSLQITQNGDLIEGITSFTLLGSLYYQLYQNIVKGSEYAECKYCGDYFGPLRRKDMKFCPNDDNDPIQAKRSKCENRYNAMVKRVRDWHFKDKLTPEQIHRKLNKPKKRNMREIEHWIETYKIN